MRRTILLAAIVSVGCNASTGAAPVDASPTDAVAIDAAPIDTASACPGDIAPAIEDCTEGLFFADCGGTGATTLGCTNDDCRWFVGGCAPDEYTLSRCPPENLCCERQGTWPFVDDYEPPLSFNLYAYGLQPWDRTRDMNVELHVDPTLVVAAPSYTCTGPDLYYGPDRPCSTGITPRSYYHGADAQFAFIRFLGSNIEGWVPAIELDLVGSHARICATPHTDAGPSSCPMNHGGLCAESGTLTLIRLPHAGDDFADLHGTFHVVFGDLTLDASF